MHNADTSQIIAPLVSCCVSITVCAGVLLYSPNAFSLSPCTSLGYITLAMSWVLTANHKENILNGY